MPVLLVFYNNAISMAVPAAIKEPINANLT